MAKRNVRRPTNFLRDPRRPHWNAHHNAVREMLGMDPRRLPENTELVEFGVIDGFRLFLTPFRGDGRRKHRLRAICACGANISAGRTHQHVCKPKTVPVWFAKGKDETGEKVFQKFYSEQRAHIYADSINIEGGVVITYRDEE